MKSLDEIKAEITDCKKQLHALYEKEPTMDPNEYIQRMHHDTEKHRLAVRIDTLFWVWENY
jgi:hypothetical protein